MTKDYAHWRNAQPTGMKRWWLILTALLLLVLVYWIIRLVAHPSSERETQQHPVLQQTNPVMKQPEVVPNNKPRFDFYELLPNQQVKVEPAVQVSPKSHHAKKAAPISQVIKSITAKSVAPRQHYQLQLTSFMRIKEAEKLQAHLVLLGYPAKIEQLKGSRVYYHVTVGPFSEKERALLSQKRLHQARYKTTLLVQSIS